MANRFDFLLVYLSSFVAAAAIVIGATIVQSPDLPLDDLFFLLIGGAIAAVFPPLLALFVPSGRRALQVMFGAVLIPFVGGVLVNAWELLRALL